MKDLATIDGLTETQEETEPMTARLAALLVDHPGRSQDALQDGIEDLERAYSLESDQRMRLQLKHALVILKEGSDDSEDDD